MKRCFLHVGFHKTASTSFQLTLEHNRQLLEQEGIYLPKFIGKNQKLSANHSTYIRDIFDIKSQALRDESSALDTPPNEQKQQTIQNHYQSLKRLLNQDHNILISGEGISTMSKQPLIRLKSKLEQHGFTVEPFALVRPPYAFITSALQQTIKNGKHHSLISLRPSQRNASQNISKIPNSSRSINTLQLVFGKRINYIPFKTATSYPGGPVLFLLKEILKIEQYDQYQLINANRSRSNVSTRLKNFLNLHHPHVDQGKLRNLFETISHQSGNNKFLLTQQEFELIKNDFKKVKREMKHKLGKPFVEEKIVFASEFSPEDANQILSQLSQRLYEIAIKG